MVKKSRRVRVVWMAVGLALGTVVGVVVLVDALIGWDHTGVDVMGDEPRSAQSATATPPPPLPHVSDGTALALLSATIDGEARVGEPMTATLEWSLPPGGGFDFIQGQQSSIQVTVTLALPDHYLVTDMSIPCDTCNDYTHIERRYEWGVTTDESVTNTLWIALTPQNAKDGGESITFTVEEGTGSQLTRSSVFGVHISDGPGSGQIIKRY